MYLYSLCKRPTEIYSTAQLIQTANKQPKHAHPLPPLPFHCMTRFTTESAPYLVNEDTVGQGLSTCTARRAYRDRDRWQVPQFRVF